MGAFLKNKTALSRMYDKMKSRKVSLFEQSDLLSEDNIINGLD